MRTIFKKDNVEAMKTYFNDNPDANYSEEFVMKAEEFTEGYKTIFIG